ncbi:hypothetical protein QM565_10395 [Geitlerinema splendidum]|nr:hypothetical protein [Geitlerinema splendidum]
MGLRFFPIPDLRTPKRPSEVKVNPQIKQLGRAIIAELKGVGSANSFQLAEATNAKLPLVKVTLKQLAASGAIALGEPETDLLQASLRVLIVSKSRDRAYLAPVMGVKFVERVTPKQVVLEGGVRRNKDHVWFLPSEREFEEAKSLHSDWNKAFKAFAKALLQCGNYKETLDAKGLKKAENPLTPYAIAYTNPDGYCADCFLDNWAPPEINIKAVKRHTACKIEASSLTHEVWMLTDSSGYACCPDLETWEKIKALREAVVAAQDKFYAHLKEALGTYAEFEEKALKRYWGKMWKESADSKLIGESSGQETTSHQGNERLYREEQQPQNRVEETLALEGFVFSTYFDLEEGEEESDYLEPIERVDDWVIGLDQLIGAVYAWHTQTQRYWFNDDYEEDKLEEAIALIKSKIAQVPYNSPGQLALPIAEGAEADRTSFTQGDATLLPVEPDASFSVGARVSCSLYNSAIPGTISAIADDDIFSIDFKDGNTGRYSLSELQEFAEILTDGEGVEPQSLEAEIEQIAASCCHLVINGGEPVSVIGFDQAGVTWMDSEGEKYSLYEYTEFALPPVEKLPPFPKPVKVWIDAHRINLEQGTQSRVKSLDPQTVREYATEMREGRWMFQSSPPVVFWDGVDFYPGVHHRIAACQLLNEKILCEVRPGTLRDAKRFSATENKFSSLKRTNEDKANATRLFISTLVEEFGTLEDIPLSKGGQALEGQWSLRRIAEEVGVSHPFVRGIWREFVNSAAIAKLNITSATTNPKMARVQKGEAHGTVWAIALSQEKPLRIAWDNGSGAVWESLEGIERSEQSAVPPPAIKEIRATFQAYGFNLLFSPDDGRYAIETVGKTWTLDNFQALQEWLAIDWPVARSRYGKPLSQLLDDGVLGDEQQSDFPRTSSSSSRSNSPGTPNSPRSTTQELALAAQSLGLSSSRVQVLPEVERNSGPALVDDRPGAYRPKPFQYEAIEKASLAELQEFLEAIANRLSDHPAKTYINQARQLLGTQSC